MRLACTLALSLAVAAPAAAQDANPYTTAAKQQHDVVKGYILKAAEKMPEDQYSFKPSPDVRSFGQLVAHVADASRMICAMATDGQRPADSVEKTKTSKADLQKALADSFAACDSAFASMDDKKGTEMVKFFFGNQPRLSVLSFNVAHNFEHYGNIVTYMRIKGLVPPSSEGR
jgi:uncharacterized damage-inducible protein DinB